MSDVETKLNFDAWFAKVKTLAGDRLDPTEYWAELWFDGYTPEEAVEDFDDEY